MNDTKKRKTAANEIGHALRLGHTSATYDIMRQGILNTIFPSATKFKTIYLTGF